MVFEVDLLKSQEINLDYILELIFENSKKVKDKATLVEDVRRVIRASLGTARKRACWSISLIKPILTSLAIRPVLLMPFSPLHKLNNSEKQKN